MCLMRSKRKRFPSGRFYDVIIETLSTSWKNSRSVSSLSLKGKRRSTVTQNRHSALRHAKLIPHISSLADKLHGWAPQTLPVLYLAQFPAREISPVRDYLTEKTQMASGQDICLLNLLRPDKDHSCGYGVTVWVCACLCVCVCVCICVCFKF